MHARAHLISLQKMMKKRRGKKVFKNRAFVAEKGCLNRIDPTEVFEEHVSATAGEAQPIDAKQQGLMSE